MQGGMAQVGLHTLEPETVHLLQSALHQRRPTMRSSARPTACQATTSLDNCGFTAETQFIAALGVEEACSAADSAREQDDQWSRIA